MFLTFERAGSKKLISHKKINVQRKLRYEPCLIQQKQTFPKVLFYKILLPYSNNEHVGVNRYLYGTDSLVSFVILSNKQDYGHLS